MAKRNQAMVMSVDERQMILLCPDGSWKAVRPEPGRAVGDIIRLDSVGRSRRWSSLVAAILVIVTLAATSIMLPAKQAMAHVSLDGLPGVDLVTNGRGTVLGSTAGTATGEELLEGLGLRGRSLADAISELLRRAKELDLLPEEMQVVLVAVTPAQERISDSALHRLHAQAIKGVQAALQVGDAVPEVEQLVVSQTLQAEANALGLSAGQYALALKAVEAGVQLDLGQVEDGNVAQALQAQGLNPGQMIKQLKQNQNLEQLMQQNKHKLKSEDKPAGNPKATEQSSGATGNSPGGSPRGGPGKGQAKPAKNAPQAGSEGKAEDGETKTGINANDHLADEEPGDDEETNQDDGSAGRKDDGEGDQGQGSGNKGNDADQVEAGSSGQEDDPAQDDARSSGPEDKDGADNSENGNKGGNGKGK